MKTECNHCHKPLGVAAGRPDGALAFCGNECCFEYAMMIPLEQLPRPVTLPCYSPPTLITGSVPGGISALPRLVTSGLGEAMSRIGEIQKGMDPKPGKDSLEYLREARDGAMWEDGPQSTATYAGMTFPVTLGPNDVLMSPLVKIAEGEGTMDSLMSRLFSDSPLNLPEESP